MSAINCKWLVAIVGPYRGLLGLHTETRSDGLLAVKYPSGTSTFEGASITRGVFDLRCVRWV